MTTTRRLQPHTVVLDADARDRALSCTAVRISVGWPGETQRLWGSTTYLAAIVAGERSVAGTDRPRHYAPRYRELVTAWLAAVAAAGVANEIYTARRGKRVLVLGARHGRSDADLQALIDAEARPIASWCTLWAQSPRWQTRRLVAWSPHTPADVRAQLAVDQSVHVRRAVVGCPATPITLLRRIAETDPHPRVRGALLWRGELPTEVVTVLLGDPVAHIRGLASHHPGCPADYRLLAQLADTHATWANDLLSYPLWWHQQRRCTR